MPNEEWGGLAYNPATHWLNPATGAYEFIEGVPVATATGWTTWDADYAAWQDRQIRHSTESWNAFVNTGVVATAPTPSPVTTPMLTIDDLYAGATDPRERVRAMYIAHGTPPSEGTIDQWVNAITNLGESWTNFDKELTRVYGPASAPMTTPGYIAGSITPAGRRLEAISAPPSIIPITPLGVNLAPSTLGGMAANKKGATAAGAQPIATRSVPKLVWWVLLALVVAWLAK